mgnify:CR=1 FL=1
MSRAKNCYDNAFSESCFGTIKTELEMADYENSFHARRELFEYICYYLYCQCLFLLRKSKWR